MNYERWYLRRPKDSHVLLHGISHMGKSVNGSNKAGLEPATSGLSPVFLGAEAERECETRRAEKQFQLRSATLLGKQSFFTLDKRRV